VYSQRDFVMLPSKENSELNLPADNFNHEEIIKRSFLIVKKLSEDFLNMQWDEIE